MVTRSYLCGGEIVPALIIAENWWEEEIALVECVLADVCKQCGELYFATEAARPRPAPNRAATTEHTVAAPVYTFAA